MAKATIDVYNDVTISFMKVKDVYQYLVSFVDNGSLHEISIKNEHIDAFYILPESDAHTYISDIPTYNILGFMDVYKNNAKPLRVTTIELNKDVLSADTPLAYYLDEHSEVTTSIQLNTPDKSYYLMVATPLKIKHNVTITYTVDKQITLKEVVNK